MVILIPARAGSKRLPHKALRPLGGKPLIDWTIESCLTVARPIGASVIVASEDEAILDHAREAGAGQWQRPRSTANDDAPDLTWMTLALQRFGDDTFVIRRPTSPFLSAETLDRAVVDFMDVPDATAMRAMRRVSEHPNKMWGRRGSWMTPVMKGAAYSKGILEVEPWSMPTQQLATVYVQTAGMEIIKRSTLEAGSLTGDKLLPLFLEGREAIDLNTPQDWFMAEALLKDDGEGDDDK